jgi:signal transduction histidine kinase
LTGQQTSQGRTIFAGVAALVALTLLTVGIARLLLNPPVKDLLLLAAFLPASGGVSLVLVLAFPSVYSGGLLRGIRGKLLAGVVLSAGLVLINVGFTAYLMFLSSHDLLLLSVLFVFSIGMSSFFAYAVAESFHETLGRLLAGVHRFGAGELTTRIDIHSDDELGELAEAFNRMAAQLQEAYASREDMEEARRQLIGAVSHDLRTPLATMRAMVESINDGVVDDPATIARYHQSLQAEIAYLSRLIDDLFELSQIDSGLLQLRREPGNLSDLVSGTLEALTPHAQQRGLVLRGEVDGAIPLLTMDTPRMQRVLYNLVQNAVRHTPADGTIVIRAVDAGAEVEVSVIDSGEGIQEQELPRIFERFYRGANKARSRDDGGSGLGLTIAKGIVELHGGRIWAESAEGRGAAFTFALPKTA